MYPQAGSRLKHFLTQGALNLDSLYVVGFHVLLNIALFLYTFATLDTLPLRPSHWIVCLSEVGLHYTLEV